MEKSRRKMYTWNFLLQDYRMNCLIAYRMSLWYLFGRMTNGKIPQLWKYETPNHKTIKTMNYNIHHLNQVLIHLITLRDRWDCLEFLQQSNVLFKHKLPHTIYNPLWRLLSHAQWFLKPTAHCEINFFYP